MLPFIRNILPMPACACALGSIVAFHVCQQTAEEEVVFLREPQNLLLRDRCVVSRASSEGQTPGALEASTMYVTTLAIAYHQPDSGYSGSITLRIGKLSLHQEFAKTWERAVSNVLDRSPEKPIRGSLRHREPGSSATGNKAFDRRLSLSCSDRGKKCLTEKAGGQCSLLRHPIHVQLRSKTWGHRTGLLHQRRARHSDLPHEKYELIPHAGACSQNDVDYVDKGNLGDHDDHVQNPNPDFVSITIDSGCTIASFTYFLVSSSSKVLKLLTRGYDGKDGVSTLSRARNLHVTIYCLEVQVSQARINALHEIFDC